MWYHLSTLEDKINQRKEQRLCSRCGLLYKKTLELCPHCSHLDDDNLNKILKQRSGVRISIGVGMLLGAVAIMFLLFFNAL